MKKKTAHLRRVEKVFARVCAKYGVEPGRATKNDFYRICAGENIELANTEEVRESSKRLRVARGIYFRVPEMNFRFIFLKCFFQTRFDRFTAFHELGHHFMRHVGGLRSIRHGGVEFIRDDRNEAEADYFAHLATGLKGR